MKSFSTALVIVAYIVGIIYCCDHRHFITAAFLAIGLAHMPDPVPKKEELGEAAGLSIPTASIAIIQEGEAKQAIKELISKIKSA